MPASPDAIRATIDSYVAHVATGSADDIMALFADGATVEDPVGSQVRSTPEKIREFYATLEGLDQQTRVVSARIAGGQAAFLFEIDTAAGEQTYRLAPIDVMTFDDDAKITSMKAYWSDADMSVV